MKIGEVMTRGIETLDESATLRHAARRMDQLDTGALPVTRAGEPVGIVTDRDIAVRGVAQGLDPEATPVRDVMTAEVIYCRAEDSLQDAAATMQERQVRRLVVMDELDCPCGIVSLGDLALRSGDDLLSESVLEGVSAPTHPHRQRATPQLGGFNRRSAAGGPAESRFEHWGHAGGREGAGAVAAVIAGAAGGVAMMYLFDPQRGRRRRALLRDRATHLTRRAATGARKTAQYTGDRTRGMIARTAGHWRHDEPSDRVLTQRVRSAIGRAVSNPGAIDAEAYDGVVALYGPVLTHEVAGLLAAVERVRGVHKVEDRLNPHTAAGSIPALQGGRTAPTGAADAS